MFSILVESESSATVFPLLIFVSATFLVFSFLACKLREASPISAALKMRGACFPWITLAVVGR